MWYKDTFFSFASNVPKRWRPFKKTRRRFASNAVAFFKNVEVSFELFTLHHYGRVDIRRPDGMPNQCGIRYAGSNDGR